jgi:molecular chaperone GrpE
MSSILYILAITLIAYMSDIPPEIEHDDHIMADEPTVEVVGETGGVPDYKELWLRAQAELDNSRKRFEADRAQHVKYSQSGLLEDLLPVVDNFYRATAHVPDEQKGSSWVAGIQYIQKNLLDVLENYHVKEMPLKPGDPFNASREEAIGTISDTDIPEDHIVEVVMKGYLLHDRVLRPAQVMVSKPDSDASHHTK